MAEPDSNLLLGRLAVHFKLLDKQQVAEALRKWRESGEVVDFGVYLISEDILSSEMVKKLFRARQQYLDREEAKPAPPVPEPVAPEPVAPEPVVPQPVVPQPAAPEPAAPASAAPEPVAPEPSAAEPTVVRPKTLIHATPIAATLIHAAPLEGTPAAATPLPATMLEPAAPDDPLTFGDEPPRPAVMAAPAAAASEPPAAGAPIALGAPAPPEPVTPEPVTPEPATPEPAVPEPAAPESAVSEPSVPQHNAPVVSSHDEDEGLRTPIDLSPPSAEELAEAYQTHPQFRLQLQHGTTLEDLLRQTRQLGGSDLHVHSGARLKLRLHGQLIDTSGQLAASVATQLIIGLLSDQQRRLLERHQQVDFSYEIPGVGRFRANAYLQQRGLDVVLRAIPPDPPTLAELGLPEDLSRLVSFHQGMVLFTGPAGCGKSSTMAAMVRMINEQRPDHIITVEDPIEYLHRSAACIVNQRQVGPHTGSFARALRGALREDPDIIVIGELRDLETISLALTAAETGHLVLGTLHTSSAIRTINRLLGVFPPDQQAQIRTMLSESLRSVVSQRLVRRADGEGRVAAIEVMINNKAVGNLIRENKTFQIHSAIQTGANQGMCLLDTSLMQLVKDGVINKEDAQAQAEKPESFK